MKHYEQDKENDHPNVPKRGLKVKEEDFTAICKQYVLDGERLRVKSIHYRDPSKVQPVREEEKKVKEVDVSELSEKDIERLEYLEEMDVINEEEMHILERVRKMRNPNQMFVTHQSRYMKPKSKLGFSNIAPKQRLAPQYQQWQEVPHQYDPRQNFEPQYDYEEEESPADTYHPYGGNSYY